MKGQDAGIGMSDQDRAKFAQMIGESKAIVFFGGAGVSTESGIPDFRSETGLYNAMTKYGCSPEAIISHSFFVRRPEVFYEYYKENLIYPDAKPNNAHLALAKLEKEGRVKAVVTQNIDGLHQLAGSEAVFELHGSVLRNICMKCGAVYGLDYIMAKENCVGKDGKEGSIPWCRKCSGMVKPDVVLYEESLDYGVMMAAEEAIRKADMLIIGGTSLMVQPAAGFLHYFNGKYLVVLNKTHISYSDKADLVSYGPIGEAMSQFV
ncbi:MAG: NAD-dependent protein deacylase [Clostridiales Family XIII bacterium]|nr:NAD-dependent protein deacylase [Clostridiales Family XIII bacterium]